MELKSSKTFVNLAKAFSGECQARTRYEFIEYGARINGYGVLAEIIDKIVYNEFNHARMLYTAMQQASDTAIANVEYTAGYPFTEKWDLGENLRLAAEDERREAEVVYPEFERIAREEGFADVARLFRMIAGTEVTHRKIFTELAEQFESGTLYKKDAPVVWKCSHCGYEATAEEAWKECPLCKSKQGEVYLHLENTVC